MRWVWVLGAMVFGCSVGKEQGPLGKTSASVAPSVSTVASVAKPAVIVDPPEDSVSLAGSTRDPLKGADHERPEAKPSCEPHDSLWMGTAGGRRVVMEMRRCGKHIGARYYTDRDPHSRLLWGSETSDSLNGLGVGADAFAPNEISLVQSKDEGSWEWGYVRGEWREGKKVAPLALERFQAAGTYDSHRARRGPIAKAVDGSFSYQQLSSLRESVFCGADGSGSQPPLPIEAFPQGFMDGRDELCRHGEIGTIDVRTVEILEAKPPLLVQRSNIALTHALEGNLPGPDGSIGGHVEFSAIYARGRVLSLLYKTDGVGIGAYPAHDQYGLVLDLRRGEIAKAEDLMKVYSKGGLDDETKYDEQRAFGERLNKQLPMKPLGPGVDDACEWGESLPSPHFTKRGLHLTANLPHVVKACQYENLGVPVPREMAKEYAKPGSLLADVLAGNWGP